MAAGKKTFAPIVPDYSKKPPTSFARASRYQLLSIKLLLDSIPIETLFFAGAVSASILASAVPQKAVLALSGLAFLFYPARMLATQLGLRHNAKMDKVVHGIMTAQAPGTAEGEGSPEFCIVLLSARSNGPMGIFDPVMKKVGDGYRGMMKDLQKNPDSGLMNADTFVSTMRWTSNTFMTILYFKSAEHVQKWARTGLHNSYWMKIARNPEQYSHIELAHELFTTKSGAFESIYMNNERHGAAEMYDELEHEETGAKIWRATARVVRKESSTQPSSKERMGGAPK